MGQQPYKKTDSTLGFFLKSAQYLDQPKTSSTRVYELMKKCCCQSKIRRPMFTDIEKHLKVLEDNAVQKVIFCVCKRYSSYSNVNAKVYVF